jgi:DNA-binding CsgD family transcriptional regulator
MGKSRHLRLGDVRAAFRLVGECRDLGHDPGLWGRHLFEGLCRLTGARVGIGGELRAPGAGGAGEFVLPIETGLGPAERVVRADFYRSPESDWSGLPTRHHDWFGYHPVGRAFEGWTGRVAARTRRQLFADRDWYGSHYYALYHRPVGTDHFLVSPLGLPDRAMNVITLHRTTGERDFSPRERRLLLLVHDEAGRLMGGALTRAGSDPLAGLSPRVRQTLTCLLEGDGEKQAAARMGLSVPTVHQYVTALYRHFGVGTRSELLARFIRRPPSPPTTAPHR